MLENPGLAALIAIGAIGLLITAGVMFFISLIYSSSKNPKWMLFMGIGLVVFYILCLFLEVTASGEIGAQIARNLVVAQFVFLGLGFSFCLAYRLADK